MTEVDALKNRAWLLKERAVNYRGFLENKWNLGYKVSNIENKKLMEMEFVAYKANEDYQNCLNSIINTAILKRKNLL